MSKNIRRRLAAKKIFRKKKAQKKRTRLPERRVRLSQDVRRFPRGSWIEKMSLSEPNVPAGTDGGMVSIEGVASALD